jgi:hypothetical protein
VLGIRAASHQYRTQPLARPRLLGQTGRQVFRGDCAARNQHLTERAHRTRWRFRDHAATMVAGVGRRNG